MSISLHAAQTDRGRQKVQTISASLIIRGGRTTTQLVSESRFNVVNQGMQVCVRASFRLGMSNGSHRNGQLVVSNQRSARAWQSHLTAPRSNLGRSAIESLRFLTNHVDIMTMFQGVGWWHTNCCAAQDKPHSVPMKSGLRGLLSCPGSWWCDFVDR